MVSLFIFNYEKKKYFKRNMIMWQFKLTMIRKKLNASFFYMVYYRRDFFLCMANNWPKRANLQKKYFEASKRCLSKFLGYENMYLLYFGFRNSLYWKFFDKIFSFYIFYIKKLNKLKSHKINHQYFKQALMQNHENHKNKKTVKSKTIQKRWRKWMNC